MRILFSLLLAALAFSDSAFAKPARPTKPTRPSKPSKPSRPSKPSKPSLPPAEPGRVTVTYYATEAGCVSADTRSWVGRINEIEYPSPRNECTAEEVMIYNAHLLNLGNELHEHWRVMFGRNEAGNPAPFVTMAGMNGNNFQFKMGSSCEDAKTEAMITLSMGVCSAVTFQVPVQAEGTWGGDVGIKAAKNRKLLQEKLPVDGATYPVDVTIYVRADPSAAPSSGPSGPVLPPGGGPIGPIICTPGGPRPCVPFESIPRPEIPVPAPVPEPEPETPEPETPVDPVPEVPVDVIPPIKLPPNFPIGGVGGIPKTK